MRLIWRARDIPKTTNILLTIDLDLLQLLNKFMQLGQASYFSSSHESGNLRIQDFDVDEQRHDHITWHYGSFTLEYRYDALCTLNSINKVLHMVFMFGL